jgi:Suppressor of fused protein (SUFU)
VVLGCAAWGVTDQTMENKRIISLPEHLEHHLGKIVRGWSDETKAHGIQVVAFDDQPEIGIRTFSTLGLSRNIVNLTKDKQVRQELVVSVNHGSSSDAVAGLVLSLAEHILRRGKALLRGEVIGPGSAVIDRSTLTSIYVTNPSPFDDSLTKFVSESPATVFAYLIPINEAEASLVSKRGWRWFEEQLERQDPDIWDLARSDTIQNAD